jgi:hypothetical protein
MRCFAQNKVVNNRVTKKTTFAWVISRELQSDWTAQNRTQSGWHRPCFDKSMMHKSDATMHEPLAGTFSPGSMFRLIIAKVRNAVKFEIPIGYQDETGFHTGVKPAEKGIKWPPVW